MEIGGLTVVKSGSIGNCKTQAEDGSSCRGLKMPISKPAVAKACATQALHDIGHFRIVFQISSD